MKHPVLLAGALLLAGCRGGAPPGDTGPADDDTLPTDDDTTPPDDDTSGGDPPPDFRSAGPHPVAASTGSHTTAAGCVLPYGRHAPADGGPGGLVVLAHGLEREGEQMDDWAAHLASWGLDVVTPTQCHIGVLDLDQEQNAFDLIELAAALGAGTVYYAGHSAGGLAAFVAAAHDPAAAAMLGLDPTEWLGIGEGVAGSVHVPAYGILGDPGACNLFNNFLALYASVPGARAVRLTEADHCDFERPTDWVCTVPCGTSPNDHFSDAEIQRTLMGLATSFLVWQTGLDPSGPEWWEPGGSYYDVLVATGAISEP